MIRPTDVHSLTEFKRRTSEFMARLEKTGRPELLTVDGRARVVVQDAAAFEELLALVDRAEALATIREGLAQIDSGRGVDARSAIERLRKKHARRRR